MLRQIVLDTGKSKIKGPADLVAGENPPTGLQTAAFLLFPHRAGRGSPGPSSSFRRTLIPSWGPNPHGLLEVSQPQPGDIWDWVVLSLGACSVHHGMFSCSLLVSARSLPAAHPSPAFMTTKRVSRCCKVSPGGGGGQMAPGWKVTGLKFGHSGGYFMFDE